MESSSETAVAGVSRVLRKRWSGDVVTLHLADGRTVEASYDPDEHCIGFKLVTRAQVDSPLHGRDLDELWTDFETLYRDPECF